MPEVLQNFKAELESELQNILSYWMKYAMDDQFGGFAGRIDHCNQVEKKADKGSVLNSRILWSFSAAYRITKNADYLNCAQRAYDYFIDHFIDKKYGGIYWRTNFEGHPVDRKKQVYAQGFGIYALSEFYRAAGNETAKQHAIDLFNLVEKYSYDAIKTGYTDAFAENWQEMEDLRLSEKDANEKKTMNTHLHILEGFSNLYHIWPDELLGQRIKELLLNFTDHIIDKKNNHLVLFFDEAWNRKSSIISYGHDIEAAWLLQEAAETIDDAALVARTRGIAVQMATAAAEGLDKDGGLWYEYEPATGHLIKEKHWWPQAEAIVGFFNAWQVSGNNEYLQYALDNWSFTKNHIRDNKLGEWVWGVNAACAVMNENDKVGIWKCPYHNSRACIEIMKRITAQPLLKKGW